MNGEAQDSTNSSEGMSNALRSRVEKTGTFIAEVLVSAGPRKLAYAYETNPPYAELCEDCTGTCWLGDKLAFWLCDGASNGMVILRSTGGLEEETPAPVFGFSARILAQDLGQAYVEHLCDGLPLPPDMAETDLPITAFAKVARSWNDRFAEVISRAERRVGRQQILNAFPQTVDGTCQVTWAATFIGGVFDPIERRLSIVNFGDCAAIHFSKSLSLTPPNTNPVRLVASILPTEPLSSHVEFPASAAVKWECFTEVFGFAAMSDGLTRDFEQLLIRLQKMDGNSLSALRTELLRSAEVTWDDKAIIFGRFRGAK
jgi:hypothetical protein